MTAAQRTVLIVEDSPTQAMHVQSLLEREGVTVALAADGPEGLALAQTIHPDLIILDMQLPGMNGLQVCQRLKHMVGTRHIPVILFTHHSDPEMATLSIQSGAIDFIPKDALADAALLETMRRLGLVEPCAAEA
jgi:two-component system cell cycle response regulator